MAKVSKAALYVYLICTVLLLEKIDAISLKCYSSAPPVATEESDGAENRFSPIFTTRLNLIMTEAPPETTSTLPVPTTTPSVTTTTPPVATATPLATTMTPSVTGQETTPVLTSPVTTSPCGNNCPRIISRADWGAAPPKAIIAIRHPIPKVFIHHTDTASCTTQAKCSRIVEQIQKDHQTKQGKDDIDFNFLVGEDGNVYEGRGWDAQGQDSGKWNPFVLGIALIGNFMKKVPNRDALWTVQKLIDCGVCMGKIARNYTVHGHRDGCATDCPGDALYNLIRNSPHSGGNLGGKC